MYWREVEEVWFKDKRPTRNVESLRERAWIVPRLRNKVSAEARIERCENASQLLKHFVRNRFETHLCGLVRNTLLPHNSSLLCRDILADRGRRDHIAVCAQ